MSKALSTSMHVVQGQPQRLPHFHLLRSRRKTIELRVYPDGKVEVRAPQHMSQAAIEQFVAGRQQWIQRKLAERVQADVPAWQCERNAEVFLFGDVYRLRLASGLKHACLDGNFLCLSMPDGNMADYQALLEHYLRGMARTRFTALIDQWFPAFASLGHQRPTLRVKKMRTRWGSLSTKGNINLNLLLVHYPLACIESVVVHELCHLEHMDHGAGFKKLQERLLPDWRQRKQQLETFGLRLPQVL